MPLWFWLACLPSTCISQTFIVQAVFLWELIDVNLWTFYEQVRLYFDLLYIFPVFQFLFLSLMLLPIRHNWWQSVNFLWPDETAMWYLYTIILIGVRAVLFLIYFVSLLNMKHGDISAISGYYVSTCISSNTLCHSAYNPNINNKWVFDDPTEGYVECLEMPAK